MNDKTKFADEMLRTLRPGGYLALADWNSRDLRAYPPSFLRGWFLSNYLNSGYTLILLVLMNLVIFLGLIKIVREELFLKIGTLIQIRHGMIPFLRVLEDLQRFYLLVLWHY